MTSPVKLKLTNGAGQSIVPVGWKSPLRDGLKPKTLQQVVVETDEGPLRVGPAMIPDAAAAFCAATAKAVLAGKLKGWGMPQLVTL